MIMDGTTMAFGGSMIVANDNRDRKMIMTIVKASIFDEFVAIMVDDDEEDFLELNYGW